MTLTEALESGKRYRRQGTTTWFDTTSVVSFYKFDILATDWEVEEERIALSAAEIREAITFAFVNTKTGDFIKVGLQKLGFK